MVAPEKLSSVALDKQPVYFNDPALAWEQRLALAYDEATAHLKKATPPGTTIDAAKYELVNELAGNQMGVNGDAWLSGLQTGTDIDPSAAFTLPAEQMRQYYLGRYAEASANLGAYLTGFARQQIPLGAISQADFDKGAELRLRALSEIIYVGRTKQLPAIIAGEQYAALELSQPARSNVIVMTQGTAVVQAQATSGLGGWPVWATVVIVLGAIAAVSATVVAVYWSSTSAQNRRAMLELCQEAIRRGDPNSEKICANMAKVVADMVDPANMPSPLDAIISREAQKQLFTYAAVGVGAYLLIQFAPEIIRSIGRAKQEYSTQRQQTQIANLARWHRRFG